MTNEITVGGIVPINRAITSDLVVEDTNNLLAQSRDLLPGLSGLVPSSAKLLTENKEARYKYTVSVREEQVRTTERTFQFVGGRFPITMPSSADASRMGLQQRQPAVAEESQPAMQVHPDGVGTLSLLAQAFEVTAFFLVGTVIAVLLSPYSPLPIASPVLLILPVAVAGIVIQAFAYQRRHRDVG